jgi:DNA-binding response OmpR family regulator
MIPSSVYSGPARVLVVEDDENVGAGLVGLLAADGHEVRWARTALVARRLLTDAVPDLALLDLALPDGDGLRLCEEIRTGHNEVVVVVVTAGTDEADAVRAPDGGADDFVTKPFRPVELRARLRAPLGRRGETGPPKLRAGPIRLDQRSRRAWVGIVEITLRPTEHEVLAVLIESAGTAVRREHLMAQVWDEHWFGSIKTRDVHVANVRRKLADAGDPLGPDRHAARLRLPLRIGSTGASRYGTDASR